MAGLEELSLATAGQTAQAAAMDAKTGQNDIASLRTEFNAEIENARATYAVSGGGIAQPAETEVNVAQNYANQSGSPKYLTDAVYRGGPAGVDNRHMILVGAAAPKTEPHGQGNVSGQTGQTGPSKGPAKIIPFPNQSKNPGDKPVGRPPSKPLTEMTRQRGLLVRGARGVAFMEGIRYLRQHGLETLMREDVADLKRETGTALDVDNNAYHRAIAEEYTENLGNSRIARFYRAPMTTDEARQVVQYRLNELEGLQAQGGDKSAPKPAPAQQTLPDIGSAPHQRRLPNQTCSNAELDRLESEKDQACSSIPGKSCSPSKISQKKLDNYPCSDIRARITALQTCRDKRDEIQQKCFGGVPDAGHKQALDGMDNGINQCRTLEQLNCAPGHPMANQ